MKDAKKNKAKNDEKPKINRHRPTVYNVELFEEICKIIETSSKGLFRILESNKDKYPTRFTFYNWLSANVEAANRYALAKDIQIEFLVDELNEISDDGSQDIIGNEEDGYRLNTEFAMRSKLRIDTRKWIASKLKPKKYGDKIQTELSGGVTVTQITGMEIK